MTSSLFIQFAISTAMLVLCVTIHGIGLFGLSNALRSERNVERLKHITAFSIRGAVFTFMVVFLLVAIHGLEIWAYAALYQALDAVPGLEDAVYYSTISYSTVGFHDEMMHPDWKLIGAFESLVGMIMIGWSTAFLFRMLGRIDPH